MLDSCRDVAVSGLLLTNLRRRFGGQLYTPLGGLRVAGELDGMYGLSTKKFTSDMEISQVETGSCTCLGSQLIRLAGLRADKLSLVVIVGCTLTSSSSLLFPGPVRVRNQLGSVELDNGRPGRHHTVVPHLHWDWVDGALCPGASGGVPPEQGTVTASNTGRLHRGVPASSLQSRGHSPGYCTADNLVSADV